MQIAFSTEKKPQTRLPKKLPKCTADSTNHLILLEPLLVKSGMPLRKLIRAKGGQGSKEGSEPPNAASLKS